MYKTTLSRCALTVEHLLRCKTEMNRTVILAADEQRRPREGGVTHASARDDGRTDSNARPRRTPSSSHAAQFPPWTIKIIISELFLSL